MGNEGSESMIRGKGATLTLVAPGGGVDALPPRFLRADAEKVLALLSSSQFNVIYSAPYAGDDQQIIDLMRHCESLCATIATAANPLGLRHGARIIDPCLVPVLPASETRNIVRTIIDKDITLINDMPEIRRMLWRVVKAVELSMILDPTVLNRIRTDVTNQNKWGRAIG